MYIRVLVTFSEWVRLFMYVKYVFSMELLQFQAKMLLSLVVGWSSPTLEAVCAVVQLADSRPHAKLEAAGNDHVLTSQESWSPDAPDVLLDEDNVDEED